MGHSPCKQQLHTQWLVLCAEAATMYKSGLTQSNGQSTAMAALQVYYRKGIDCQHLSDVLKSQVGIGCSTADTRSPPCSSHAALNIC